MQMSECIYLLLLDVCSDTDIHPGDECTHANISALLSRKKIYNFWVPEAAVDLSPTNNCIRACVQLRDSVI